MSETPHLLDPKALTERYDTHVVNSWVGQNQFITMPREEEPLALVLGESATCCHSRCGRVTMQPSPVIGGLGSWLSATSGKPRSQTILSPTIATAPLTATCSCGMRAFS